MKQKIRLHHASIEDRKNDLDVNCDIFTSKHELIDFIDEKYCGKNKKVVFIALVGNETSNYFITDNYLKAENYFLNQYIHSDYYLFEEETFEEAFEYCKDHCEIHELGLNP